MRSTERIFSVDICRFEKAIIHLNILPNLVTNYFDHDGEFINSIDIIRRFMGIIE